MTTIELALPAATAAALNDYAAWVQRLAKITPEAALTATADFALRQIFRRDRLWQEHRKTAAIPEPVAGESTQPILVSSPAASPPPPPVSRPVSSPNGAATHR